ncbi:glycoside hydrolase family 37 protein [Chiua virens]|nr:glycoside hydrolase family 37 protein [Chiua virens]
MFPYLQLVALIGLASYTQAAPQTTTTAPATTGVPTISVTTAVASATVPLTNLVPSQAPLPPVQPWCISGQIFCPGYPVRSSCVSALGTNLTSIRQRTQILQTVNLAQVYSDPKTIVDKPTSRNPQQVLADFAKFNLSSVTEGDIVTFEDVDFLGEGLELEGAELPGFNAEPPFLNNITDPLVKAFAQTVNGYWPILARQVNQSALCSIYPDGECESTFIPLNHSFIIPGGRFREQYYWDSFWIIQGLLKSGLNDTVNSTLQDFMDEIRDFGFIPNGGRTYYLDRSQPPLFVHMLYDYVTVTGDTSILERGLPSAETELAWWASNRTLQVTSPYTRQTYSMAHYATVHDPTLPPMTDTEAYALYGEFASGAETGWDFSSRFEANPQLNNLGLRTLNVRNNIPTRLIPFWPELYGTSNATAAANHLQIAADFRAGILDLMWDASKLAFYDFNITSNSRNSIFTAATFYPVWNDIIPDEVLASQENAFGYFAAVNMVMNRYNGTFPVTFVDWTGQQWDAPNAWPPHQYIIIKALEALPANLTTNGLPTPGSGQSTYNLIPAGQLNFTEAQLPGQPYHDEQSVNMTSTGPGSDVNTLNGTVVNGGNATSGEDWAATLIREMANRYVTSTLCSWHATGGSIPGLLPQLPPAQLNLTGSINNTGNMYEKFSNLNVDSSGFGGEYTVQTGFGWTNGVLLWATATYGQLLATPQCPSLAPLVAAESSTSGAVSVRVTASSVGAMGRCPRVVRWIDADIKK